MSENKGKIITLSILGVILVALIVALIIINNNNNSVGAPNSTVEMSVNPDVELVVDANNKVVSVNYKNNDAEIIFSQIELAGKNIEEVARLFVQQATEAGYINIDTDGTTVEITVNGLKSEDIQELETKVVNSVNKYFDENGIIAGAIATAKENVEAAAQELGVSVEKYRLMLKAKGEDATIKLEDLKDKTEQELMEQINANVEELENIAIAKRTELNAKYEELHNELATKRNEALGFLNAYMQNLEANFDEIKARIQELDIPDQIKNTLLEQLDTAKESFKQYENEFKTEYANAKNQIKEDSKKLYEEYKATLDAKKAEAKSAIDAHKATFEENKADIEAKIKAYRESIKNA